jgi:long-chain acyl-CoA synthetase
VLGRPDPDLGEIVAAVVEVEQGVTAEQLEEHVKPLLSSFAVPSAWWLREEPLPVSDAGKTDKLKLAAEWPEPSRGGGG